MEHLDPLTVREIIAIAEECNSIEVGAAVTGMVNVDGCGMPESPSCDRLLVRLRQLSSEELTELTALMFLGRLAHLTGDDYEALKFQEMQTRRTAPVGFLLSDVRFGSHLAKGLAKWEERTSATGSRVGEKRPDDDRRPPGGLVI